LLNGARQTGKSTLAQEVAKAQSMRYVTLDDATQLAAASSDAQGFLAGLGVHLVGISRQILLRNPTFFGHLLETFVVSELRKQLGWAWAVTRVNLFHYRTTTGQEVDILLEDAAGQLVGLEVKAAATVGKKDFIGFDVLADSLGERFVQGIVLYTGEQVVSFSDRYAALPVSALWRRTA